MDSRIVEWTLILGDKVDRLVSDLAVVREAVIDGQPRFSPKVCEDLTWAIASRSYAPALHELCHLAAGAQVAATGGYVELFGTVLAAHPPGFRSWFTQRHVPPGMLTVGSDGITLRYADGEFGVTFTRMPVLAAYWEFLSVAVGYAAMDDILWPVLAQGPSRAALSQAANQLARALYDYLRDALPTAQVQRKRQVLLTHMEERGDVDPSAVSDEAILGFWLTASLEEGDFKTFQAVFRAFLDLRRTLVWAIDLRGLDTPVAIGTDRAAGEVEPLAGRAWRSLPEPPRNGLLDLAEGSAGAVKLMSKREAQDLATLAEADIHAPALPLSVLRCDVFASGQRVITQALRDRRGDLSDKIATCWEDDYPARDALYGALAAQIDRTLLACLHALARGGRTEALTLLPELRPGLDLRPLAKVWPRHGGKVVALSSPGVLERLLDAVEDPAVVGDDLASLFADARKAFRGVNRRGFDTATPHTADGAEAFAAGAPALLAVARSLAAFRRTLARLWQGCGGADAAFEKDRITFVQQFHRLYGAPP